MSNQYGCGCSHYEPDCPNRPEPCSCCDCGECLPPPQPRETGCGCHRDHFPCGDLPLPAGSGCTCQSACPDSFCDDPDVPVHCSCTGPDSPKRRFCCDQNGQCRLYPCSWRNKFWPEFSHPGWLCCKDLYNNRE